MSNSKSAVKGGQEKPAMSSLGLEGIGDLSALLEQPEVNGVNNSSGPLHLALELIDEDPNQPRTNDNPGFSKGSLEELAATILLRGVKTPISVRENQDDSGRFTINHGARRVRASVLAGKETIPAFIDNDYNEADQVIENLQRNELTAREIADFIGRELAKGAKKSDIATAIGKSAAFVSQHVTLLDLPEPIAEVFKSGRANDVTVVNELVKMYRKNPDEIVAWLSDETQELTRGSIKLLREFLADKKRKHETDHSVDGEQGDNSAGAIIGNNNDEEQGEAFTGNSSNEEQGEAFTGNSNNEEQGEAFTGNSSNEEQSEAFTGNSNEKLRKAIVQVKHDDRLARLILNKRPSVSGRAWLKYEDDGHEFESELVEVSLVALLEG